MKSDGIQEYNSLCPCKDCTGKGLGWIKHLNAEESQKRLERLERERHNQLVKDGIIPY